MFGIKIGPVLKQYLIVIVANFTLMHVGLGIAWLSPVTVELRKVDQTVLPEALTENEMAWMMSISSLTSLTACLYISQLTNRFGRKSTLVIVSVPRLASCLLLLFASRFWMLLLGRMLSGVADYIAISAGAMYSSEIAGKDIRGGLGTVSQVLSCLGSMLMLCIGPFVSYNMINIIYTLITFGTCIPILFLPESPYFLYSKGKIEKAQNLLILLRGSEALAREELKEYSSNTIVTVNKKDLLKDRIFLKTVLKVIFLALSSQMIGYNAVVFYLQTIFETTNTSVSPEVSSAVIGCIQLLACFCTMLLTDRCGRKPVLLICLTLMAVGMVGLGAFFKMQADGYKIVGWLNYLPLVSMMLVIFCFNAGMGSLVWTVVAELFEGPTRALGVSIGVFVATVFLFLTTRYFPSVSYALSPAGAYWLFGAWCVLTCLFIAGFVPETNGKAFSEIQRDLGRDGINKGNEVIQENKLKV